MTKIFLPAICSTFALVLVSCGDDPLAGYRQKADANNSALQNAGDAAIKNNQADEPEQTE